MRNAILTIAALLTLAACDAEQPDDRPLADRWCEHADSCFAPEDGFSLNECKLSASDIGPECYWQWADIRECELEAQTCELGREEGPCAEEIAAYAQCVGD